MYWKVRELSLIFNGNCGGKSTGNCGGDLQYNFTECGFFLWKSTIKDGKIVLESTGKVREIYGNCASILFLSFLKTKKFISIFLCCFQSRCKNFFVYQNSIFGYLNFEKISNKILKKI